MLGSLFQKIFPKAQSHQEQVQTGQPEVQVAVTTTAKVAADVSPRVQVVEEQSTSMIQLCASNVLVNQSITSKTEALALIAEKMQTLGYVSADYQSALEAREAKVNTFMCNGLAIPHGINEAKHLVVKTGVVIVQVPAGIQWSDKGDRAHLIVGIAAKGDDHMELLQQLATVAMDDALMATLGKTATVADIAEALGNPVTEIEPVLNDLHTFDVQQVCTVVDAAGIHARPASAIAEIASQFTVADICILSGGKSANAQSMASVLNLGARQGDELIVAASGEQAEQAVKALCAAINHGLDNDEQSEGHEYQPLQTLAALNNPKGRALIKGAAASSGIAMAPAFVLEEFDGHTVDQAQDAATAKKALEQALVTAEQQLLSLQKELADNQGQVAIFKAHSIILKDPEVAGAAFAEIKKGASAAGAWQLALSLQITRLEQSDNETVRGRAADMKDVRARVLAILRGESTTLNFPKEPFVLVAAELTPSQTAQLKGAPVQAICTALGGPNSHMAILARGLGIPAIVGMGDKLLAEAKLGTLLIVDPQSSSAVIAPDQATETEAAQLIHSWNAIREQEQAGRHLPAVTLDGHEVMVVCNIAQTSDAPSVIECGSEGVGLLRTEFLFESAPVEPTVAEQAEALAGIVKHLGSKTLIVRTADIGADKPVSWLPQPKEDNPFLGCRGIRLSAKYTDVFRRQLEAIYKVAVAHPESGLHIMFPMISTLDEWRWARDLAESVRTSLSAPAVPLGIMIEVPSAALMAEHFAKEVDFFSIGSNDLTQYTMAVDRMHPELCHELDSYNPSLLKMMNMTVQAANAEGKWVGVCGNMAGIPDITSLLVGMGVKELSVSPANVAAVKQQIRSLSYRELQAVTEKALGLATAEQVHALFH